MPIVTPEIQSFLESGAHFMVGTANAECVPESCQATGARVHDDGEHVTVFVPTARAARTLANLRVRPKLAVTASRPIDHRAIQLKGEMVEIREPDAEDQELLDTVTGRFLSSLIEVGHSPWMVQRLAFHPTVGIHMVVREVFDQTPGPGAGTRLDGSEP